MKSLVLLACVIGVALCAPQMLYYELEYKPVRVAPQALAAPGAPVAAAAAVPSEVEILLAQQAAAAHALPARGFIKHEIPQPAGRDSIEVLYPFGFAPAAPAAPAVPVAPVAPVARAPLPRSDDDDENDD
ncbi:translation initiation factor IF-2 [Astyanax mexicanus]|uniref:Secretory calcium-binding phosphoprotein 7 n=1 Tax=Astyanax mexicanus TaxID=7994 RepID=A0A3B1K5I9_ASTMX|nr:translation initiation factor IF-2 [Astyanax mexicanus]